MVKNCLPAACVMSDVPVPSLFEFWSLSLCTIEEQLLIYDIPFTENHLIGNKLCEQSKAVTEENIRLHSSSIFATKPIPEEEEYMSISDSLRKPLPNISLEQLLKSVAVTQPKIVIAPKKEEKEIQTPTIQQSIKTDKYGFVVAEESEEKEQNNKEKGGRERGSTSVFNRKKNPKSEDKWIVITQNWNVYLGEKRKKLKRNLRRGVPDSLRASLWKGLMEVNTVKAANEGLFQRLLEEECSEDFERVILKDLSRTLPHHIMFQEGGHGKESLHKVLKAYSLYNPSIGYCQGMGFLAGMFLIYLPAEEAFFMLVQVIEKLNLSGIFAEGLLAVKEHLFIHALLSKTHFPRLTAHLSETVQVHGYLPVEFPWDVSKLYATQWFFNIFIHVLPFEFILRIWDILLLDGFAVAHQVALAILKVAQKDLMKLQFDQIMVFMKEIDGYLSKNITADQFIAICMDFKVAGRITKLSKSYIDQYQNLPM